MIKRLSKCIREYKKDSILAPVFVILEVLLECVIPFMTALLIDKGINVGDMGAIIKYGVILVLLAMFALGFGVLSGRSAAIAASGFAKNLRHDIFYNVQNFSFSNIDKFSTSSIVTRLTTDITNVQNAYMMIVRIAVRSPVMLIFAFVMATRVNSTMALIFLAAIPVLGIGLYFIMSNAHPVFKRVFETYDDLNNVVQENLRGIRVVKSFVREEHEKKKFGRISNAIYNDFSKAQKIIAFNAPLMQFVIYGCMICICWIGARLIVNSGGTALTTGGLTSLITYLMQMLMSLMMLSMVFMTIVISRASTERIYEILEEKSSLTNGDAPIEDVPDGSISFKNVNFSYKNDMNRLCLMDIDLDIASGETIGILGGTGASKSTLVQLIPRLYDVTSGSVAVGGHDVRDYDVEALRNAVAMVLQKNVLFSGTIKENLRWGSPDATDEELREACRLAQADDFISKFPDGYDTYIEQGGTNVSGGQKQRICIARALLKKPKILILDDSTSAVDTHTDALIRKAFREYIPETTKIIIAQRVSSIEDADKIIVMDGGRISACGTHEQLIKTSEIYREVYNTQMKGGAVNE